METMAKWAPLRVIGALIILYVTCTDAAVFSTDFQRQLQSRIDITMGCHHVPGLTLAVVKDTDVWTRGFGTADFTHNIPVDGSTLFSIASVTKSFTMTLLSILLKEKGLDWTAKVTDILGPGYRFVDDYRTRELTLRDLLSHRTGLATLDIGWAAGFPANITREDLCKYILEPRREKRDLRACVIVVVNGFGELPQFKQMLSKEKLGGDSWENLVSSRIFQPIGMRSTKIRADWQDTLGQNTARPYIYKDGRFQNGTFDIYSLHPTEPAGAIMSNAVDMAKYMQFHLNNGRTDTGVQLADTGFLAAAHTPVITMDRAFLARFALTQPEFPINNTPRGYGYAWNLSTYGGYKRYWHSGSSYSYVTILWLFPDKNLGIFASVNGPAYHGHDIDALESTAFEIADHLLGEEPWLNDTTTCTFPRPWRGSSAESGNATKPTRPHLPESALDEYTGVFGSHYLPSWNITKGIRQLDVDMNNIKGLLHATTDTDRFTFEITEPWELVMLAAELRLEFNRDVVSGAIVSLTFTYEVDVVYTKGISMDQ